MDTNIGSQVPNLWRIAGGPLMMAMVVEYARYNGHADLPRERIDGRIDQ